MNEQILLKYLNKELEKVTLNEDDEFEGQYDRGARDIINKIIEDVIKGDING